MIAAKGALRSESTSTHSQTSKSARFDDSVEDPKDSGHFRSKNRLGPRPARTLSQREQHRMSNNAKIAAEANAILKKLNEEEMEDSMRTHPRDNPDEEQNIGERPSQEDMENGGHGMSPKNLAPETK